ncbi:hypothetical protein, partial [Halopseudomonas yangmingensis]|uniref:hypothetical protein n=1 Tax=Halopseudomonas yangmingensis TaxID=1720063 RepID=UPI001C4301BD
KLRQTSTSNTPVRPWLPDLNEMASIKPGVIQALFVGASYAFVGFGFGYSAVQLGDAHSIGGGWQIGWDVSVSGGAGISTFTNVSWESCCEG